MSGKKRGAVRKNAVFSLTSFRSIAKNMKNTCLYVCITATFVAIVAGSMPEGFRQAIANTYTKMEQFLLEDSEVDPNRHCDWILMRDNEVLDKEGKRFQA